MASYEILNGANLAYIGDAYFELRIRKYLIDNKITKSNDLRKLSIKYVSAHAHQQIIDGIFDELTQKRNQFIIVVAIVRVRVIEKCCQE